jgi:hypothetical protein
MMAGKIEQAIGEALEGLSASGYIGTTELCARAYGIEKADVEKKHRVSVLRAARRYLDRNPRFDTAHAHDGEVLFFDGTSLEARFWAAHSEDHGSRESILKYHGSRMEPGGRYWRQTEIHKAKLAGDSTRVEELETESKRKFAASCANLTATLSGEPPAEQLAQKAVALLKRYFERTGESETTLDGLHIVSLGDAGREGKR